MTQPLKLAVVCYPGLGGSGVVASELVNGLAAQGHHIHVVSTDVPERLHASLGDIQFERITVPTSPVFEHGPYDVAVANHLVELVRHNHIDLIHLHYAVPHAASALLAKTVLGDAAPAIVTTLHGTDVTRAPANLLSITSFALAACDGLTTPSDYLRTAVAERYGLAAERIEVIPNFVDLERFTPPARRDRGPGLAKLFPVVEDGPILFHVSNFRPIKRTLDLIEVLARVRRTMPARAVLVGDGPERDAVAARAVELGLGDAVCLLGRRDDFAELLAHADAFVLPSESEGFGVAALEAMASGVPVFGYHVGGLPEVVVEGTGTLVPCCDVDALAAAIIAGLAERDTLGRAARARAEERFGWAVAIDRYDSYFRRVIARRAKADS